jgi:predicted NBD/HSP70 family sugar kinase
MTNPSRIIIGGWVGLRLMERHALAIRDAVLANCLDRFAEQVEVRAATFGGDTVALGSALMPVEALVNGPGASVAR